MIKPAKFYKSIKHKKIKSLGSNIAVHPFVIIGITAAIALVVLVAVSWRFWAK